ncbi:MAG: sugar ABC transporter ATP-binding protein [Bowdeniella nasicola]|nr:sugar ABC transporter ATP-binding protein [Bowdeniella nasicola]
MSDVSKIFGATKALTDVSLTVNPGEVHSLLGRNGAGKSTLVNIIAGIYPPTSGTVTFEGEDIGERNIFERQELGIRLVPQHENSFPDLSVGENIFAGLLPVKNGLVDWATVTSVAEEELADYGLDVSPDTLVKDLSSIDARKLNIIRAMHGGAKLIILDEPTTALTNQEREELFEFVNELRAKGTAFIFISHYLGEVLALSDSITVLRDGLMFPVDENREVTEEYLGHLVAGEELALVRRAAPIEAKAVKLRADSVTNTELTNVSIDLHEGEVLGIVGFPGSGARAFCRTLFGLHPLTSGRIELNGLDLALTSPGDALRKGLAYISFDRHREGVIPTMDIDENIGISIHKSVLKRVLGFIDLKERKRLSNWYRDELKIKCNNVEESMDSLSGGNQQKVVVSRLLNTQPEVLILDEPTVGIDIKSRNEIISKVLELSESGMSTIYLTNDYEELLRVSDRLAFFDQGRIHTVMESKGLTIEALTEIRDQEQKAS